MITIDKEMEAIVKHIGAIKSVEGLDEYYQSLSVEQQNNRLLKGLIDKRKQTIKDMPIHRTEFGINTLI